MSFDFLKNKRFFILIFIIILLAGGFFYWQSQKPTPPEKWDTARVSQREDYKIIEQDDGLLVKNKKAGLSFELPERWNTKEELSVGTDLSLYSSDAKIGERNYILQKGCKITSGITSIETDIKTLKNQLKDKFSRDSISSSSYKEVKIKGHRAVEQTFKEENMNMYVKGIHIPVNNRLYEIVLNAASQDQKRCSQEFEKISDTITIK